MINRDETDSFHDYWAGDTEGEHRAFNYSTETEVDNAEAYERGATRPDVAWICTDRDVWHRNPYYSGPPVRHPEDQDDDGPAAPNSEPLEMPF
jgi:hypothetical protein